MDERVDIPVPAAYRKSRTDEYYLRSRGVVPFGVRGAWLLGA